MFPRANWIMQILRLPPARRDDELLLFVDLTDQESTVASALNGLEPDMGTGG